MDFSGADLRALEPKVLFVVGNLTSQYCSWAVHTGEVPHHLPNGNGVELPKVHRGLVSLLIIAPSRMDWPLIHLFHVPIAVEGMPCENCDPPPTLTLGTVPYLNLHSPYGNLTLQQQHSS